MTDEQQGARAPDTEPTRRTYRRRAWWWIGGAVAVLVFLWGIGLCALVALTSTRTPQVSSWGGDAVAVIYVEGSIGVSDPTSGAGVSGAQIVEYIRQAEDSRRIKAIVVYINSPGGAVVPSDQMYRALREATKPVVAAMGDVAASGGYYVACGAEHIVAHPATITGSIGVYGRLVNAAELLEKLGVEGIIVRSGDSKAIGNWFERPTVEQIAIQQAIVDELYDLFVTAVVEGRGMDEQVVRELGDGRAYTGQQALDVGLVDSLGSLDDAVSIAADLGGIEGEPEIVEYRRAPSMLQMLLARGSKGLDAVTLLEWLDTEYAIPEMRYIGP